jgi:serine/threonine-protein kinase
VSDRQRLALVLLLCVAGAWLAWLLLLEHHGLMTATVSALCGEGMETGCALVSRSRYASLAGVPLAALGLAFYASLAVLALLCLVAATDTARRLAGAAFGLVALALAADLALLGLQAFAIGAYCRLCLATYAVNAALLAALWPARAALASATRMPQDPDGKTALSGWGAASVLALAGAIAADGSLAGRAAAEARKLLGAPEVAPSPAASATPSGAPAGAPAGTLAAATVTDPASLRAELERAQAEARRLQQTLDEPQKLQAYMDAKAAREFDEAKPLPLDLSRTPSKGPANAPVKVVEYSDFLCPFCRNLAGAFTDFLPRSQGRIALYYKHYPLEASCNPKLQRTVHEGACLLALGGVCAQELGAFWRYHDQVFEKPVEKATREDVARFATQAGLDAAAFSACLDGSAARDRLAADVQEAQRVGVQSTPTILVNGKRLPRINDFLRAIDKESQRLGLPPLPQPKE